MFEFQQLYCLADPVFYDDVARWREGRGYLPDARPALAERAVPQGWSRDDRGFWVVMRPDRHVMPEQGWKVHVSATLDNADRLAETVWDYCVAHGIAFKYLGSRNTHLALNFKYAPRGASGKMMTIYPQDEDELRRLLEDLGGQLEGAEGPYILSDLRWEQGPLYVRYGAFRDMHCLDVTGRQVKAYRAPDGRLEPDRRGPVFAPPSWARLPPFLEAQLAARKGGGGEHPYRVRRALHFSNGGGVYEAERTTDGRTVVLKEARPHAGLDRHQEDAVRRLQREHWALTRLQGVSCVPQCLDYFVISGHHFLAQDFVAGQPLTEWTACNSPWLLRENPTAPPDADSLKRFTERALRVCDAVAKAVEELHAAGVVFGDLHPGNVMVQDDDSVRLIDFEFARDITERAYQPGLGATGFASRGKRGADIDWHGLAAVRIGAFVLLNSLTRLTHAKTQELVRIIEDGFPVPPGWGADILSELDVAHERIDLPAACAGPLRVPLDEKVTDWEPVCSSMARAIVRSATPDRTDRLFPGDPEQFATEAGGHGFAHGAAGVLWALAASGQGRFPHFEQWLVDGARTLREPGPGFYEGASGIAYALDELGYSDTALDLMERHVLDAELPRAPGLHSGLSGIALNLQHLGERHALAAYLERATALTEQVAAAIGSATRSGERHEAGLLHGWSGAALLMLRRHQYDGDERYLDLAVRALRLDLDSLVTQSDGSLQYEEPGVRTLGYLDTGSAGIALVAHEVLQHHADARLAESLPQLVRACSPEYVVQSSLFRGRAGLLATVARIGAQESGPNPRSLAERHLQRLHWHAIPYHGEAAFPGVKNLRLSMDLATGTAGVLLAVSAATSAAPFLPFTESRSVDA
ncbi:class III lanthionine synthetase LanKC [Streptomyces sp. NPDC050844]|uniref:class III lanthionine synthetase LanKC n=1 Tax=Streptomyces sp. NPDC050844 TaxID=3155790 RepID=UPI0033E350A1